MFLQRREWQPTPVFLPGESHWWRSLVGYGPGGHKESDMTEQLTHISLSFPSSQLVSWSFVWLAAHRLSIKGTSLLLALRLAAGRPSWALSPARRRSAFTLTLPGDESVALSPGAPPLCCRSLQRACLRGVGTAPPAQPWAQPGDRRLFREAQTLESSQGTACLFSDWWLDEFVAWEDISFYFLISMFRKIVCIWACVYVFLKDVSYFYRQTQTVIVNPVRRRSSSRLSLVRKRENCSCLFLF